LKIFQALGRESLRSESVEKKQDSWNNKPGAQGMWRNLILKISHAISEKEIMFVVELRVCLIAKCPRFRIHLYSCLSALLLQEIKFDYNIFSLLFPESFCLSGLIFHVKQFLDIQFFSM